MRIAPLGAVALAACAPSALPPGMPAATVATYRCVDGRMLAVRFDNRADKANVRVGGERVVLRGQRPASGIWYAGGGYELRGKGRQASFTAPGSGVVACVAR